MAPVKEEVLPESHARHQACDEVAPGGNAISLLAKDIRRTGRCIGLVAFIVYCHLRRVRVHVVLGARTVDWLQTFAPALAGGCGDVVPSLTTAFCRCMTFWDGNAPLRVARALSTDADLVHGNHWVIAVPMPGTAPVTAAKPHYPCQGSRCGKPGGSCMSPLMETLRP